MAGRAVAEDCGCYEYPLLAQNTRPEPERQSRRAAGASPQTSPWQAGQYDRVLSKVRITGLKVFGVSLTPQSDRPYVFVKLETNVGVVGWGEATLEGKAGAAMACVEDFRDFLIGSDPMQVEHHWQSMYVHSFYRAGPVMGSAISGIDQALWDIRGKILGMPVYKLLGGPVDPRGVRGYYHARARTREDLARLRETAVRDGVSCFKTGPAGRTFEWIETHAHIDHFGGLRKLHPLTNAKIGVHELDLQTVAHHEARLALIGRRLVAFLADAGLAEETREQILSMYRFSKAIYQSIPVDFTYEAVEMRLGPFELIHLPGHCPGHVAIRVDDVLFCGDMVVEGVTPHLSPESINPYSGLEHYLESLARLAGWSKGARLILNGHDDVIADLPAAIPY